MNDPLALKVVNAAIRISLSAHFGVANKHDGEPYILHVQRVASQFQPDSIEYAVAWLHDVVEDTGYSLQDIEREFMEISAPWAVSIVDAVDAMTKRKGESNEDYYWRVKRNEVATNVKIADIHDNFGRNHLIHDEATRTRMMTKYSQGLDVLCRS